MRDYLDRPGGRIWFEVAGSGPAIVFAHGLGGNHLSWWQQVPFFARTHTCVTFAHRGFVPSTPIAGGPEPADYHGDLAALIDHLRLPDVRLVAQSMGGWACVEYALAQPARVKALVLADTAGTLDIARLEHPAMAGLKEWEARGAAAIAEQFKAGVHPAAGLRCAREQPALHFLYQEIDGLNRFLDKEAVRVRLMKARARPPADARNLAMPVLLIVGDEDVSFPPFAADALAPLIPRARVVHVPEAGHSVYFERADTFNRLVAAFLAESG